MQSALSRLWGRWNLAFRGESTSGGRFGELFSLFEEDLYPFEDEPDSGGSPCAPIG